jgi:plasmid stability protein
MWHMKNLTISMDDDLHRKLRIRAAEAGQSMSRYIAMLMDRDIRNAPLASEETKRRQLEALQRLIDAPKIDISENGRMPTADERNARR